MKPMLLAVLLAAALSPARAWAQGNPFQLPGNCPAVSAATSPFLLVVVGTVCTDLSQRITTDGKLWFLNITNLTVGDGTINQLTATFNPDPFITFGASTTNVVPGPVTYAFLYGTPVVPDFYTAALSTAGVSVTSGASGLATVNNSGIYPTYVSGYGTVGGAATNLGVDLGTAPCTAGPGAPASNTTTCNYGTTTNTFAPTFYNNLEALLTYTQTDVASVASWSGSVVLTAAPPQTTVPEPFSMVLMGTGLAGIGAAARRRRQRKGSEN